DLHRPGIRRHRRDDRRRSRLDEHPVLRLPGVDRRRIPVRLGVRVRDRRRHLLDRHRDVLAARALRPPQGRGAGMTRRERRGTRLGVGESRRGAIGLGIAAWVVGVLWIFPVAWTLLTSFKTEQDASSQTLHQGLTFARYSEVSHSTQGTLSLGTAFATALVIVLVSTIIVLLLALPAPYALAIRAVREGGDVR